MKGATNITTDWSQSGFGGSPKGRIVPINFGGILVDFSPKEENC